MTFLDHDKDLSLTLNIIIATGGEKDLVPQRDGTEALGMACRYRDEMTGGESLRACRRYGHIGFVRQFGCYEERLVVIAAW